MKQLAQNLSQEKMPFKVESLHLVNLERPLYTITENTFEIENPGARMLVYIIEIKTIINQINKDLFLFYFLFRFICFVQNFIVIYQSLIHFASSKYCDFRCICFTFVVALIALIISFSIIWSILYCKS